MILKHIFHLLKNASLERITFHAVCREEPIEVYLKIIKMDAQAGLGVDQYYQKLQEIGGWVAWSVERPTSAQATISGLASSSASSGLLLSLQSLLRILCPLLSAPPVLAHAHPLSQ